MPDIRLPVLNKPEFSPVFTLPEFQKPVFVLPEFPLPVFRPPELIAASPRHDQPAQAKHARHNAAGVEQA
jgi:hypothetical protein